HAEQAGDAVGRAPGQEQRRMRAAPHVLEDGQGRDQQHEVRRLRVDGRRQHDEPGGEAAPDAGKRRRHQPERPPGGDDDEPHRDTVSTSPSPMSMQSTIFAFPLSGSTPTTTAARRGSFLALSNRPGIAVRKRWITPSFSIPMTESYGPVIPMSVQYAVPCGK